MSSEGSLPGFHMGVFSRLFIRDISSYKGTNPIHESSTFVTQLSPKDCTSHWGLEHINLGETHHSNI